MCGGWIGSKSDQVAQGVGGAANSVLDTGQSAGNAVATTAGQVQNGLTTDTAGNIYKAALIALITDGVANGGEAGASAGTGTADTSLATGASGVTGSSVAGDAAGTSAGTTAGGTTAGGTTAGSLGAQTPALAPAAGVQTFDLAPLTPAAPYVAPAAAPTAAQQLYSAVTSDVGKTVGTAVALNALTPTPATPPLPDTPPPPQPAQVAPPSIGSGAGAGQNDGVASTMLTGPQGIDPATLLLGKPILTGSVREEKNR